MDVHSHFKMYKPVGFLSQMTSGEARQIRNKRFLTELYDFPEGTMPIGRLDEKSEGLLLLTTDGKLADTINSGAIEKEYWAQLDGSIDSLSIKKLEAGVTIGIFGKSYTTKPCRVEKLVEAPTLPDADPKLRIGLHRPTSWIKIILTEGKFRQIRKMTAAVGYPTVRLIRVRVGSILLEGMQEGSVETIADLSAQLLRGKP
ncbi:pseudouridine synthase [Maribacter aurantiacus]|uniref:Pseudouridine synthase n=1 Tax=Maribacter aurantiacus TaxID=1882343 RepID=A0A5R8LUG9_9FLAO|nr:pseudouridine synthase [Maribacter aurantiacus]TLF40800.1 pseudouridine synthase [Maribacter aurantiacus]